MKTLFKYFVYLSLIFLFIALYKANYFCIPKIYSPNCLLMSFLFLFTGHLSSAISWRQIVRKNSFSFGIYECIAGVGLSIFGKYIPGKVWMIIGRATYLAKNNNKLLAQLSMISLNAQFIMLWLGLVFGAIGLLLLGGLSIWGWLILFLWIALTVVVFSNIVNSIVEKFSKRVLKKEISIPKLSLRSTVAVLPWFILTWLLWSIGFFLLVASLVPDKISPAVGLGFPLAGTLGIMAIIAPGGLGVREGVMVGYLNLAGLSLPEATTISITARLWFLIGEIFIFIVGIILDRHLKKRKRFYRVKCVNKK